MTQQDNAQNDFQFQQDVSQNKVMAILAYFIFFLPLIAAKESKFARYHSNQGLVLLIGYVALGIVKAIIESILTALFFYGAWGIIAIFGVIFTMINLGLTVLGILGIVNAAQGKMEPMPIIGKFILIR